LIATTTTLLLLADDDDAAAMMLPTNFTQHLLGLIDLIDLIVSSVVVVCSSGEWSVRRLKHVAVSVAK
jgi:hypothetical protein